MARDEDVTLPNGPLGTVIGVFFTLALLGSGILWHASGGHLSLPVAWLMADVSHTAFEWIMAPALILALVFAAFVTYCNRAPQGWDLPEQTDTGDTDSSPKVVPPIARQHDTRRLPRNGQ